MTSINDNCLCCGHTLEHCGCTDFHHLHCGGGCLCAQRYDGDYDPGPYTTSSEEEVERYLDGF